MKFLNTDDRIDIIDIDDIYSEYIIEIKDCMLDLRTSEFIQYISNRVKNYNYCKDSPVLFTIKCDEILEDDIEYIKDLIYEVITESIIIEKTNKDWQPKIEIDNKLDTTMKAKTNLLNYSTLPNILDIKFVKNEKMLYNIIKE